MYLEYNVKAEEAFQLLSEGSAESYFDELQKKCDLPLPIGAYVIKPVQRIMKYPMLLKDLLSCVPTIDRDRIQEGLEVCQAIPTRANNIMHLSLLQGWDESEQTVGPVVLQDSFSVVDSKKIIRKSKQQRIFMFKDQLIFAKEEPATPTIKPKYSFKAKLMMSELGLTEHVKGDELRFAVWTGQASHPVRKFILTPTTMEVKRKWVQKLRALTLLTQPPPTTTIDLEDMVRVIINRLIYLTQFNSYNFF
jgi:hypothetical protein